jgi:hypothetical protein
MSLEARILKLKKLLFTRDMVERTRNGESNIVIKSRMLNQRA